MSLRIIYGRAGCGKTHFCLNEIKAFLYHDTSKPLVLLVPEQYTFQAERDLINVLETGGILKTEVLSFRRLAFRVFNEVGGITYPHIHSAGKCMIIYRILDKMRDKFKVFGKAAHRQGFVSTLSTLITELKRYSITPLSLEKVCIGLEEENPLKGKLIELGAVYTEFEKTLVQRYRDSDDDLTSASEKLSSAALYDGAEIWIDGFSGFTPQEFKVIEQLLKKAERVNISLCIDNLDIDGTHVGIDTFSSVRIAYKKLISFANDKDIKIQPAINLNDSTLYRFINSPSLSHLEKNLYAYPYKTFDEETNDISLFSSVNIFLEIEAAARNIIGMCRDKNMHYRDIAVVTRNLISYEKLIEVIFAQYDIPCFIDRKSEITNHPLVRLILSMLEIFIENWSYESVFRYLKSGLTGVDRSNIDLLENYVLACGIRGSRWTNDHDWNMSPELIPDERGKAGQSELLVRINEIRVEVSTPLLEYRKKTKGRRKASELCGALYDFLCSIGVPEKIEVYIENFSNNGNLTLANEYSQVWNIVMEIFDQTVEVMGDETFGIERFSNILKIGIEEYKVGLIPVSLDQVLVGSVERSKSHEIKALYILGVNDGIFPSSSLEEGILSDQDRVILANAGIELASDTKTQAFDEQYLVYRALTTAGSYLRISWPIADNEGKTHRPSMIINRLRKLYPKISETSNILKTVSLLDEVGLLAERNSAFKSMVTVLRQKADGKQILSLWQDVYRWYALQEKWKQKCEEIKAAFQYKNLAKPVNKDKILSLYGDPVYSSVSRLEKYTECPFAFYVQYGLGARDRKVFQLSPPDVGTFMHAVIEKFSRLVAHGDISWRDFDREWCSKKVSEIVDEMLQKMQGSGISSSKRYTALIVRLKRVITRAVWLISEHIRRSSFNPVDYEVDFSEKGKYPPITIELDSGKKIHLTGRIDRVDALKTENGQYLRIIDYKSGNKDFSLSDVFYGLQIQLVTYLDAVGGEGDRPPVTGGPSPTPAGILYFRIDDPIIKGDSKISEEKIELAIMKQLKMRGLLLADVRLIKEMDNTIDGTSLIIPATLNKGDVLGKNTSAASLDQFKLLRKYVRKLLKEVCTEVMKGNVSIKPFKKKGITSCKYCSFLSICQFDTSMKENTYKLLYDKHNEEVWSLMGDS